ncbi:MAG: hydantoinase/oxoprolinase family protein [Rhizobiales bacterium]|nr:hydantoinase/oxoprolinase family protein [Hyphomicrobiales bacterium]
MGHRVGVDIGGTFADFCAFDEETGRLHTLKVLSRPDAPGSEVVEGIRQLDARFGVSPSSITYFTHGTTVGVNTVIQRKGVHLALFTTARFTDVLEIGRLKMPDPYDILSTRAKPLISKDMVFGIGERILSDGSVDEPLDPESVAAALAAARARGAKAIVVALINSYRNPRHEQETRDLLRELAPEMDVYCSSEVWSIVREYERTITAVIHSYVQRRVADYLTSLQKALAAEGVPAVAQVTKSNGGVMNAELGKTQCAQMILSGTAAGVIGASFTARLSGFPDTMSLDIGGTSADIAIIRDGQPQYGVGEVIGEFPIYLPTVAVTSIGAGGGSIASLDDLGILRVGPESAGSVPGPACYGRGGTRPTITDAFAVLGFIGQAELGYSAVKVDLAKARAAVASIADPMGRSVEETAEAIVKIAISGMYLEVSKLMSRSGIDPRSFVLQAFGGAGPMMACFLAPEIGVSHVVIPTTPGVLSALGGLIADIKNDFIKTVYLELDEENMSVVHRGFETLRHDAERWLREEQNHHGASRLIYAADMRYRGQSYEIETALTAEQVANGDVAGIAEAFHATHERIFDHCDRGASVQIINLRMVIVGESPKPHLVERELVSGASVPEREVRVYLEGAWLDIPLYRREAMLPGQTFTGPAVVAQADCTTCIPSGYTGRVDGYGHLILEIVTRQ